MKTRINRYLFHELSVEGDEGWIGEQWPFKLREISGVGCERMCVKAFEFSDGQHRYFAQAGRSLSFWEAEDMTEEDLRLHILAEEWIQNQGPIELYTARATDPTVPSIAERRRAIEEIASASIYGAKRVLVLEGLFFPSSTSYIALVETCKPGGAFVVGTRMDARKVRRSNAAPWRRLYVAIGRMLQAGDLDRLGTNYGAT